MTMVTHNPACKCSTDMDNTELLRHRLRIHTIGTMGAAALAAAGNLGWLLAVVDCWPAMNAVYVANPRLHSSQIGRAPTLPRCRKSKISGEQVQVLAAGTGFVRLVDFIASEDDDTPLAQLVDRLDDRREAELGAVTERDSNGRQALAHGLDDEPEWKSEPFPT